MIYLIDGQEVSYENFLEYEVEQRMLFGKSYVEIVKSEDGEELFQRLVPYDEWEKIEETAHQAGKDE